MGTSNGSSEKARIIAGFARDIQVNLTYRYRRSIFSIRLIRLAINFYPAAWALACQKKVCAQVESYYYFFATIDSRLIIARHYPANAHDIYRNGLQK